MASWPCVSRQKMPSNDSRMDASTAAPATVDRARWAGRPGLRTSKMSVRAWWSAQQKFRPEEVRDLYGHLSRQS